MRASADDVLLLRPAHALDAAAVREILESTPGAFRHPANDREWVLPAVASLAIDLRAELEKNPQASYGTTRVRDGSPFTIEVIPSETIGGAGRARKFVTALLALGPFELEVRGERLGIVETPAEIYGEADWIDPDQTDDPTESPPRTGKLITFYRDQPDGPREYLAVHDSGVLSYEQRRPSDDAQKTYRVLDHEARAALFALVATLPFEWEPGGGDGSYVDPAYISLEVPTGYLHDVQVDAGRPSERIRAFVELVDGWVRAFRANRAAAIAGMSERAP